MEMRPNVGLTPLIEREHRQRHQHQRCEPVDQRARWSRGLFLDRSQTASHASGLYHRAASRIEIAAGVIVEIFPAALAFAAGRSAADQHYRWMRRDAAEVAVGPEILVTVGEALEVARFRVAQNRHVRDDEEVF